MARLTEAQWELLSLLGKGPRFGITDARLLDALKGMGLAISSREDHQLWGWITPAGRAVLSERAKGDGV